MGTIHHPSRCWFVDAARGKDDAEPALAGDVELIAAARAMRESESWDDARLFEGDVDRFSATFRDPLGPQSVARGGGPWPWASVVGEFEVR